MYDFAVKMDFKETLSLPPATDNLKMKLSSCSILWLIFFFVVLGPNLLSQEVPHPVSNYGAYEFLDELASIKIIEINSAVKPYSRLFIARSLMEADAKRDQLNTRQQKELDFYLMDFGKELNERRNGVTALRRERRGNGFMAQRLRD